jgi:hypothetical protein
VLVGKDPYVALDKLAEKQRWLRDRERRIVPQTPVNAKTESSRLSIDDAVDQYFKNLRSKGKDPKTIRAYKVAVEAACAVSRFDPRRPYGITRPGSSVASRCANALVSRAPRTVASVAFLSHDDKAQPLARRSRVCAMNLRIRIFENRDGDRTRGTACSERCQRT